MSSSEIEELKERIQSLSERGQKLREREMEVSNTVKYLLELIREKQFVNYNKRIIDIIIKYQELQARQQSLLEKTFVSPQNANEFFEHQSQLQQTLKEITQFESQKEQMKKSLESSFTVEELPKGHFLFTLNSTSMEAK